MCHLMVRTSFLSGTRWRPRYAGRRPRSVAIGICQKYGFLQHRCLQPSFDAVRSRLVSGNALFDAELCL